MRRRARRILGKLPIANRGDHMRSRAVIEYTYASYRTLERAEAALDDMFSAGEVSPAELVGIVRRDGMWRIILRA